jgi:ParB/RepB/Spo0J family partition protein
MHNAVLKSDNLLDRARRILEGEIEPSSTIQSLDDVEMKLPPAPPPLPSHAKMLEARANLHVAKHAAEKPYIFQSQSPKFGEFNTRYFAAQTQIIRMDAIRPDPEFTNFRQSVDPTKLAELQESIRLEGLKVPIIVVDAPVPGYYHVRAGFRRVQAIQNLNWETVSAIVLPFDTPRKEEYWINIIENTAREKLTTYELASAAKMMRDQFDITPTMFAQKSGHSLAYIQKLLGCIDRLPEEVLQCWKIGDRMPIDILAQLACLSHHEAIRNCRLWLGQHRLDITEQLKALQKKPGQKAKLWTVKGLERTQRLHMAVKTSKLPNNTKQLCLEIIEYLQGARTRIPDVIDDRPKREAERVDEAWESFEKTLADIDRSMKTDPTSPIVPNQEAHHDNYRKAI